MMWSVRNLLGTKKFLLAGLTFFCVCWLVSVGMWHGSVRWAGGGQRHSAATMPTIVAYSEGKLAEMERPFPVACDRLPAVPPLKNINYTWSANVESNEKLLWQQVPGTEVTLFNAFYDKRQPQLYIRVLAMFPGRVYPAADKQLYCQTRLQSQNIFATEATVEVVAAKPLEIWYRQWDPKTKPIKTALLLSCPLTEPLTAATIVSIVTEPCENPKNAFLIKVHEKPIPKRNFTICVKDMNFEKDISGKLIEWIETNRILGVDKIDMYIDQVHTNTEKIIKYYRETGYLRLLQAPLNNRLENRLWQRRRNHIVTYNDCLYRNLDESEFIIPLDIDEIIIPKTAENLPQLIDKLKLMGWNVNDSSAAIIRNAFFFDTQQKFDEIEIRNNVISKIYEKRDDVRICKDDILDIQYNNSYIAMNGTEEEELNKKYVLRCGKEMREPKLVRHITRSKLVSPKGSYSKSILVTSNSLLAFNHYPLLGINSNKTNWFAPLREVQVNHYKENCNTTLVRECWRYQQKTVVDCSALRLRSKLLMALAVAPCY